MNNVDLFIKYLSGEMNQEEAGSFERDLASKPELKESFEDVSAAFRLIKDQLQKRDEDSFREKLEEVMENPGLRFREKRASRRPTWYFLLPLAGSLAILLAIYLMNRGADRIMTRFYDPTNDPVVLAINQGTRGETESGIILYQDSRYGEALNKMSELLDQDPENQMALLYYLLASIELNLQGDALEKVMAIPSHHDHQLGQSIIWYTSLALVKSSRKEEAAKHLQPLIDHGGPYETDARRLQKLLLK